MDLSGLRRELDAAILPGGFIDYEMAFGYARGIERVLDRVEELRNEGFPDAAIEAAEHALGLLEDALGQVDDSDGEMGAVKARAQDIHLAACEAARPDPVQLGERLARWALRSDWEIFLEAPSAYAGVLGQEGLATFEAVVDEQFQKLPRLAPGDDEEDTDSWFDRFRPRFLKESLAALRGADEVVEVIAHDLSSPYQFFRAAEVLAAADRVDEALDWLSRGRAAFGNADERLADMAADLHHRAGRHGRPLTLPGNGSPRTPAWARTNGCTSSPPQPVTGRSAARRTWSCCAPSRSLVQPARGHPGPNRPATPFSSRC